MVVGRLRYMLAFLPGTDGVLALARRVDTARHHGVPNGCVLELNLHSVPPETSGFDPLTFISGVAGEWISGKSWPPYTARPGTGG